MNWLKLRTTLWVAVLAFACGACANTARGARGETVLKPEMPSEVPPPGTTPFGLYVDKPSEVRTGYWRFADESYRVNAGEDFLNTINWELRRRGFAVVILEQDPEAVAYVSPLAGAVSLKIVPPKMENDPPTIVFQAEAKIYDSGRRKLAEIDLRNRVSRDISGDREQFLQGIWREALKDLSGRFSAGWDQFISPDSARKGALSTAWNLPLDVRFKPNDPNQLENAAVMDSLNPLILKLRENKNVGLTIELHVYPEPPAPEPAAPPRKPGQKAAAPKPAPPAPAISPESLAVGRGGALRRYVSEWGIGADRITVKIRGQEVPLVPMTQPGAARTNNRIDFVLTR